MDAFYHNYIYCRLGNSYCRIRIHWCTICALVRFLIIDGFRASILVASIAPSIEAKTIILLLLLLITLLNTNLIYLRLEGTLSNLVIFYHAELLNIRRIELDLKVQYENNHNKSSYLTQNLKSSKQVVCPTDVRLYLPL